MARRPASATARSSRSSNSPTTSSGPTRAADVTAFLAEIARRTAVEAGGEAAGVELLTYHRAKGLEWDAVFLPALEEGHAADPPGEGTGRAGRGTAAAVRRDHPGAALPVAVMGDLACSGRRVARVGAAGRGSSTVSCPRARREPAGRSSPSDPGPAAARATPKVDPADRSPLSNALRAWRTARAKADAVAPFIIFHDSTIEAIAERRPRSIADLRRVPGIGPMKLDRYGEEIIGVVVRDG